MATLVKNFSTWGKEMSTARVKEISDLAAFCAARIIDEDLSRPEAERNPVLTIVLGLCESHSVGANSAYAYGKQHRFANISAATSDESKLILVREYLTQVRDACDPEASPGRQDRALTSSDLGDLLNMLFLKDELEADERDELGSNANLPEFMAPGTFAQFHGFSSVIPSGLDPNVRRTTRASRLEPLDELDFMQYCYLMCIAMKMIQNSRVRRLNRISTASNDPVQSQARLREAVQDVESGERPNEADNSGVPSSPQSPAARNGSPRRGRPAGTTNAANSNHNRAMGEQQRQLEEITQRLRIMEEMITMQGRAITGHTSMNGASPITTVPRVPPIEVRGEMNDDDTLSDNGENPNRHLSDAVIDEIGEHAGVENRAEFGVAMNQPMSAYPSPYHPSGYSNDWGRPATHYPNDNVYLIPHDPYAAPPINAGSGYPPSVPPFIQASSDEGDGHEAQVRPGIPLSGGARMQYYREENRILLSQQLASVFALSNGARVSTLVQMLTVGLVFTNLTGALTQVIASGRADRSGYKLVPLWGAKNFNDPMTAPIGVQPRFSFQTKEDMRAYLYMEVEQFIRYAADVQAANVLRARANPPLPPLSIPFPVERVERNVRIFVEFLMSQYTRYFGSSIVDPTTRPGHVIMFGALEIFRICYYNEALLLGNIDMLGNRQRLAGYWETYMTRMVAPDALINGNLLCDIAKLLNYRCNKKGCYALGYFETVCAICRTWPNGNQRRASGSGASTPVYGPNITAQMVKTAFRNWKRTVKSANPNATPTDLGKEAFEVVYPQYKPISGQVAHAPGPGGRAGGLFFDGMTEDEVYRQLAQNQQLIHPVSVIRSDAF